jgi:hypothetical protein
MDLSISHGQAQRLLKQRNLLAITATGLFALSVVLTLTAAQPRPRGRAAAGAGQAADAVLEPYRQGLSRARHTRCRAADAQPLALQPPVLDGFDPRDHRSQDPRPDEGRADEDLQRAERLERLAVLHDREPYGRSRGADQRGQWRAAHGGRLEGGHRPKRGPSATCGATRGCQPQARRVRTRDQGSFGQGHRRAGSASNSTDGGDE